MAAPKRRLRRRWKRRRASTASKGVSLTAGRSERAARTFLQYPPMQKGATFNLEALKQELEKKMEMMKSRQSQ